MTMICMTHVAGAQRVAAKSVPWFPPQFWLGVTIAALIWSGLLLGTVASVGTLPIGELLSVPLGR